MKLLDALGVELETGDAVIVNGMAGKWKIIGFDEGDVEIENTKGQSLSRLPFNLCKI